MIKKNFKIPSIPFPHPGLRLGLRQKNHDSCPITKEATPEADRVPLHAITPPVLKLILKDHPECEECKWVSRHMLAHYRNQLIHHIMADERGQMTELEQHVAQSIKENKMLTVNVNEDFTDRSSLGARIADMVAKFGGSWAFVIAFTSFIALWIVVNVFFLVNVEGFDPYPFILLNLALSCIAALQAPIIMMSQNRQNEKDRMHSEHEYKINLKAEFEIQNLTHKMDLMLEKHWSHMLELQEMQINMLNELSDKQKK
ncbi:DUF1003 domain-containing protein [Poriferisphaera sp. WC338]|uniref:DUF1003 domain-containing protein n=1 Tax=Poriferisphaera sp. WC338 TaxID=3425129 RepID=UPI003D8159D1